MNKCPCCGQLLPPKLSVTGTKRKELVELLSRRADGMTREQIAAVLWEDDPNGGPDNTMAVCQLVHQARLQLRRQGYTIWSNRGPGARYRIMKLEA
jgi:hypothetical protein